MLKNQFQDFYLAVFAAYLNGFLKALAASHFGFRSCYQDMACFSKFSVKSQIRVTILLHFLDFYWSSGWGDFWNTMLAFWAHVQVDLFLGARPENFAVSASVCPTCGSFCAFCPNCTHSLRLEVFKKSCRCLSRFGSFAWPVDRSWVSARPCKPNLSHMNLVDFREELLSTTVACC